MLPAETFEMKKRLSTLSLAKPIQNTEATLNTYELFTYGDIHYINNSFCKSVLKIATQYPRLGIAFFIIFSYCYRHIFTAYVV
jgi:hypothetical protein